MTWKEMFAKKTPQEQPPTFISDGAILETEEDDSIVEEEETMNSEQGTETPEAVSAVGSDVANPCEKEPAAPVLSAEKSDNTVMVRLKISGDDSIVKAALYLAMSCDIEEERTIKDALSSSGWRCVATEVGGISGELPLKVSRALVGASLNSGVVRKVASEMHALMHAAQEAFSSFIPQGLLETSVGAKIAIVRNSQWLAVAVAGDAAYHAVAHHARVGVGVMHL